MRFRTTLVTLVAALTIALTVHGTDRSLEAQSRPASVPIRLYVFDGGTLESDPARYQLTKEDVKVTQLSVAAYLIVHPKGLLMWDSEAVPDSEWTPTGSPIRQRLVLADGQERFVTITRPLAAQLLAAGHKPAEVTHLVLSHYHWDHTANASLFPGATWLVRQFERDAMFSDKATGTSRPQTYAALKNSKTTIITADEHDVFGDGTVILKAAAGHTPGHQVLYLKMAKTGAVVLSGDLYHYPQERTLDRLPTFEFNEAQTRAARMAVEAFLKKTGAELWIQHNVATHAKLKKAPLYYE